METKIIPATPIPATAQIDLSLEELGDILSTLGDNSKGNYALYSDLLAAWREAVNDKYGFPTWMEED